MEEAFLVNVEEGIAEIAELIGREEAAFFDSIILDCPSTLDVSKIFDMFISS
jgi:hypothetical protein